MQLQKTGSANISIPILTLMLVSFSVYFNALFGHFVYDDILQIVKNPWITDVRYVPTMFSKGVWGFKQGTVSNYYRPLMHVAFTLSYHLFGLKSWGFHLVNILFHCGVSVLVFLSMRALLTEQASLSSALLSPPFMAAMLFASHPIHTEAVAWISGLPDVAFTFFYLLSFYLYVRSKAVLSLSYVFSVLCFAVAAFFKEPALTLPAVLLAYDYLFRKEQIRFLDYVKRYSPYIAIVLGYLALRIHALGEFAPVKSHVTLSAYQYAINIFPLFTHYLEKLLLPLNLNAFYVFHPINSLYELKGALSLIATAVFAVLLLLALKKNRVTFLGLVFVTVPLLPALYIPALGESTFADRYLYLPSVGYVLLLANFLSWAGKKMPRAGRSVLILFIVIWGLYTLGTIDRNNVWKDSLMLWTDTVVKSPDSAIAHNNLGDVYASQSQWNRASTEYQTAVRLKPDYADAHYNLGFVYESQGQWDSAIAEYQTAVRLKPDYVDAHYNLGFVYASKGQWERAIEEDLAVLRLQPDYASAYNELAFAYASQGEWDSAIAEYQTALRLKPDYAEAHNNLGYAYASQGRWDSAIAEYQTALRLKPDYAETHNNLADAYASQGQWDSAIAEYQTALRLKPDFYEARQHLNDIVSRRH
jgi:tetratricopeptide (TPR) repeat protein